MVVMFICCLAKRRIHSNDELFTSHVRAWTSLWSRGRVDVVGDLSVARAAYASWYYILSSIPLNYQPQFTGVSPCGLSHSASQVCCSSRYSIVDSRHICLLLLLKTVVNCNVASASVSLHTFSFYGAL